MIKISSILSEGFAYARIDLYIINNKIYFGEVTFTSSSGTEEIVPRSFERKLTKFLKLPKIAYNIDTGEYYRLNKPILLYPYCIIFIILILKLVYISKKIIEIIFNTKLKFID